MSTPRAAVKLASLAAGIGLAALLSGPGFAADDAVLPDIVLPEPPAATLIIEAPAAPEAPRASAGRFAGTGRGADRQSANEPGAGAGRRDRVAGAARGAGPLHRRRPARGARLRRAWRMRNSSSRRSLPRRTGRRSPPSTRSATSSRFGSRTRPGRRRRLPSRRASAKRRRTASIRPTTRFRRSAPRPTRPGDLAEADLKLSAAAVLYARDARGARVDPARLSRLITPKLELPAGDAVLTRLAAAQGRRRGAPLATTRRMPAIAPSRQSWRRPAASRRGRGSRATSSPTWSAGAGCRRHRPAPHLGERAGVQAAARRRRALDPSRRG